MKPSLSFGLRTMIIAVMSVGLALAFNATRPDSLPLTPAPKNATMADSVQGVVSLDEAARLFSSGQAVFVDARSAQEYAKGHIEEALSIPVFDFAQVFPELRTQLEDKIIITYCDGEGCALSQDLADQLKANGLANVSVLKNGWSLWQDAGLPVAASKETAPQETVPQGNLTQEISAQKPTLQDPEPHGNLTQDTAPQQQASPMDPLPQEHAPETPTPQDPKPAGDPS